MVTSPDPGGFPRPLVEDINAHDLSSTQLFILKMISLVAGSVSVVSVLLVSYWFIRMRRRFRHDLIMLLMQSDMLKAVWFMVYPAVEITQGRVPSESKVCQASGFFLTLGIEACDIAVLLIAIHTALNIYRRSNVNGLYPFRKYAFAAFAGVPLILSLLAFQNTPAFANSGEYCYLPMRPRWTRMALSWIPRYVIFGTILFMYIWIYFHVRFVTRQFDTCPSVREESNPSSVGRPTCEPKHTASVPPLPQVQRHGLVPSPVSSPTGSAERRGSLASAIGHAFSRRTSTSTQLFNTPRRPTIRWKIPSFRRGDRITVDFQPSFNGSHRRASSASSRPVPSLTKFGKGVKWENSNFGHDASHSFNSDKPIANFGGCGTLERRRHTAPMILPLHTLDIELAELQTKKRQPSESSSREEHVKKEPTKLSPVNDVDVQDHAGPSTRPKPAALIRDSEISPRMSLIEEQPRHVPDTSASASSSLTHTFWNRPILGFSRHASRQPSLASMIAALRRGPQGSRTSSSAFLSPTGLEETGMAENREALRRQTRQLLIYPIVYLAVWICPFISHLLGGRDVPFPLMAISLFSLCIQGAADALVFALRERPWRQIKTDREDEGGRQLRVWWRGAHDSQTPNVGRTPDEMLADERSARRRLNDELEQRRSERNESERHLMPRTVVDWWDSRRVGDSS